MSDIDPPHKDAFANGYFSFIHTAHWVEKQLKNALKPLDLTHAQLNILYILFAADGQPLTAKQIKNQLIVTSPDLTRMMDRLVQKGWVVREACETNRRQVEHIITAAGRKTFRQAHIASRKAVKNFFAESLNEREAKQLKNMMEKIRS